ncbi:MAG: biopolymer transporter ExbD [Pseudomonadota bacterium]
MINVVFLLLIFFLMTAEISTPPPVEVDLPSAATSQDPPDAEFELYLSADGLIALGGSDVAGEAVWAAIVGATGPVTLRADADTDAIKVAQTLSRLAGIGLPDVELAVVPR